MDYISLQSTRKKKKSYTFSTILKNKKVGIKIKHSKNKITSQMKISEKNRDSRVLRNISV